MKSSLAVAAVLLFAQGCSGDTPNTPDAGPNELPCDVKAVVEQRCAHCHASPPTANAPTPLLSRADFQRRSTLQPDKTLGQLSAERLKDALSPMPPLSEPPMPAEEAALLERWVREGMPHGTCGALPEGPAATTCASGTFWRVTDPASATMAPGLACRECHLTLAPERAYFFSGTVFPAFHEKDGCNAPPPPDARVEIIDDAGKVRLTLLPNAAGNFVSTSLQPPFPMPYRARVVANNRSRTMTTAQRNGDCNTCHTEQGRENAPGRIVWP
ncbi:hypothetical protein P2318_07755 [Myxococcaceae bacterium GXIMD 01537]